MATKRKNTTVISDAYLDFVLSRKAKLCSEKTLEHYDYTLKRGFLAYLAEQGIKNTEDISARHVRFYLSELAKRGLGDYTVLGFARDIKAMLRFFYAEKYLPELIVYEMPKVAKKKLPYLKAEDLPKVLSVCESKRDKCIILFMVDSGLRRTEFTSLNWGDVNINTGLVLVRKGKGGKSRSTVIGVKTRRLLLDYHRDILHKDTDALFHTYSGHRLAPDGLRSVLLRISNKSGIKFSPHSLRRSFATLSLKAGMNIVHIQGLMGHSTVEMTRKYIQDIDEDLVSAHNDFGPIDKFL